MISNSLRASAKMVSSQELTTKPAHLSVRLFTDRPAGQTGILGLRPRSRGLFKSYVAPGRGGRGRFGRRLWFAADDNGEQPLAPQPLGGLLGVIQRYRVDDTAP